VYLLLSAVITMSEQVVPSDVVQCITVKFLTTENVKSAEILIRLRWWNALKYPVLWLVKGRVVPVLFLTEHHAMKAYWGVEVWIHACFDLGTRWRWVVGFRLRPLYSQGKRPWYPFDRRLSGPQSRESNPNTPIFQPVTQRYTDWAITAPFYDWWPKEVENMGRLHILQENLWPVLFGTLNASHSSISWYNNKSSTQIIIRSFLKTE
jgi:hypothetical protein